MKVKLAAAALGAAVTLALPAAAQAEYFVGKRQAEGFARDYATTHYSSQYPVAYCRPQGRSAPEAGYIYHRWVCGWADEDRCEGRLVIVGSRGRGWYYGRVMRGQRCP